MTEQTIAQHATAAFTAQQHDAVGAKRGPAARSEWAAVAMDMMMWTCNRKPTGEGKGSSIPAGVITRNFAPRDDRRP
jgi:hypothetical protein